MIWLISLIALWLNPIISFFISNQTKANYNKRRQYFKNAIWTMLVIVVGIVSKVSTTSFEIDFLILAILHFVICLLLWFSFFQKSKIISILSVLIMIAFFGIGYLLSTVGILGLGFITGEYEPSKSLRINNSTVYREYGLGNATTSWGGTKVCLFTNYCWFPVLEREFFSKEYIGGAYINKNEKFITPKNSYVNNSPTFYATDLNLKYDKVNEEIILSNDNFNDTLHLNKKK